MGREQDENHRAGRTGVEKTVMMVQEEDDFSRGGKGSQSEAVREAD